MITTNKIRTVVVQNPNGMHLRACASIAQRASHSDANAEICRGQYRAGATSVLELAALTAEHGTELTLEAEGPDAESLLNALVELFANSFHEEDGGL